MESDAVLLILEHVRSGAIVLTVSRVHFVEVAANPDLARREHVEYLLNGYGRIIPADTVVTRKRTEQLFLQNMGIADAAHVASAEAAGSDFVSVDDRLLRQCARMDVDVWCGTPMAYCEKEGLR